jgi:protein-S-isoprenylcysteine O-methyltransferase Ste14
MSRAMVLIGEFLIFPNWISLICLIAATDLMHRQVLREEEYLKGHYGEAYEQYCRCISFSGRASAPST